MHISQLGQCGFILCMAEDNCDDYPLHMNFALTLRKCLPKLLRFNLCDAKYNCCTNRTNYMDAVFKCHLQNNVWLWMLLSLYLSKTLVL